MTQLYVDAERLIQEARDLDNNIHYDEYNQFKPASDTDLRMLEGDSQTVSDESRSFMTESKLQQRQNH